MKVMFIILRISLSIFIVDTFAQETKMLSGIATDGHRNPLLAVNVVIKGTVVGTVTDKCGRFSIAIINDDFTLLFHGMSYDDMRTYEIRLKKSEINRDTLVFQLGYLKIKNPNCTKVNYKLKRHVVE